MSRKPVVQIIVMVLAVFVCWTSFGEAFAKDKKEIKKKDHSVLQIETTGIAGSNDALVLFEEDITEEVEKQYLDYSIEKIEKDL